MRWLLQKNREYKLIGRHKGIELIADDICQLRDEFYPRPGEEAYGNMVWVTTSSDNKKPRLGQRVEDYKNTGISLPLISEEDLRMLENMTSAERDKAKIIRLVNSAYEQGGLLTIEELALMVNRSPMSISRCTKRKLPQGMDITEISHLTGRAAYTGSLQYTIFVLVKCGDARKSKKYCDNKRFITGQMY